MASLENDELIKAVGREREIPAKRVLLKNQLSPTILQDMTKRLAEYKKI